MAKQIDPKNPTPKAEAKAADHTTEQKSQKVMRARRAQRVKRVK